MKLNIEVTESMSIVESNVKFVASFFTQENEFAKAFDAVFKDVKKLTDILSKLGVPTEAVNVSPIKANSNWVRVEKSSQENNQKKKEYELVQKGFVAYGGVVIKLPLSWADNKHKFSAIYSSIDGLKTKSNMSYDFYADEKEIEKAKIDLRGQLINAARLKLNELMLGQGDLSFELSSVTYGISSHGSYRGMVSKHANMEELHQEIAEPKFDADTIDNMISLDFAPKFEISDSIVTQWKTLKNKKKK